MAHFPSPSGLLIAAEWHRGVENVVAVDPHRTRAQVFRGAMSFTDILRPNGGGKAVFAAVGPRKNFFRIVKWHGGHNGPEDFFPHHLHVFASVHKNRGLDEIAFVALSVPPRKGGCALREAGLRLTADPA